MKPSTEAIYRAEGRAEYAATRARDARSTFFLAGWARASADYTMLEWDLRKELAAHQRDEMDAEADRRGDMMRAGES
jgi:hypothetical protein